MKIPVKEFVFSQCDISHIDEILKIQDEVFEELGDESNILRKNSKEMLLNCLSKPHYTLGAFYNQQLIGFAILYVPGDSNENLGNDIGIQPDKLNQVANIKLIIIKSDYRGNSLQKILTQKLERIAKSQDFKVLCTTVSPDNFYSKKNIEDLGYIYHSQKIKYGNLLRNIYYKLI